MPKYVFLSMPAYGHVNPTLAVAQELVNRGQEVIYYLPEEFADAIRATGAGLRTYHSHLKDVASLVTPNNMIGGRLQTIMVDESLHVLPQVLERIRAEQADYIVYEFMCIWARIVIQTLKIPAIALRPTYAMNENFDWAKIVSQMVSNSPAATAHPATSTGNGNGSSFSMTSQQMRQMPQNMLEMLAKANNDMAEICKTHHVPPIDIRSAFSHAEQLNIIFIPKEFQPKGETFDNRYVFVGPSISPRREKNDFPLDKLSDTQPILYISLGTVFNNQPEFFKMCVEAFGNQPWQVVLSYGKNIDPSVLGTLPKNFLVSPYVPQLEVLPRVRVFLTHCGMNSTMESLYYGVPMVAVPQMFEQAMTARRITEMGLGVTLEKEMITPATLRQTVAHVANDPAIRQRVQNMQQITRSAGGYQRAAEAIIEFARERVGV
jgi:MGT family glycosyltransferase